MVQYRQQTTGQWAWAYNTFMSSTSRYVTAIIGAACVFELGFGFSTDLFWESNNRGVSWLARFFFARL
jgi:hypothetical protein